MAKRSAEQWHGELQGKPVEEANEIVVADGTEECTKLLSASTLSSHSVPGRGWLDRHSRMVAWKNAIITNTAAGFDAFLDEVSRQ